MLIIIFFLPNAHLPSLLAEIGREKPPNAHLAHRNRPTLNQRNWIRTTRLCVASIPPKASTSVKPISCFFPFAANHGYLVSSSLQYSRATSRTSVSASATTSFEADQAPFSAKPSKSLPFWVGRSINLPYERGCEAHFDGDVLLHCVVDAILGALGLPDIGQVFPDSNPKWKGAPSSVFIKEALKLLLFLGLCCKQRPFNDPPRKLKLGALGESGFCKMVDFGEEKAMVATISQKLYFFTIKALTNSMSGIEYIMETKVEIRGYVFDTWRSIWICLTWIFKHFIFICGC